jgi:hypothetical protein
MLTAQKAQNLRQMFLQNQNFIFNWFEHKSDGLCISSEKKQKSLAPRICWNEKVELLPIYSTFYK